MSCSSFPSDGVWNVAQYGRGAASNRHLDLVNWLTEFSRHQQTRHSPATKSTKPRTSKWTSQKGRRNQQTFSKRNIRRSFHRNHLRRVYGPLSTRKKILSIKLSLELQKQFANGLQRIFLLRGHSKIVRMFSQKFVFFFLSFSSGRVHHHETRPHVLLTFRFWLDGIYHRSPLYTRTKQ